MTAQQVNNMDVEQQIEHVSIRMPFGLLGFESVKEYVLLSDPSENPFMWLQMNSDDEEAQTFLLLSPFVVCPDYSPNFDDEEIQSIGITRSEDVLLLNIVTLRGPNHATINLKGPIVLNRSTLEGKQIIPINAAEYRIDYPVQTGNTGN